MSRIGITIRNTRLEKGLTQKQLAKAMGVSEKYIEELETGKRVINDDLLKKAYKALGQEINDSMIYAGDEGAKAAKSAAPVKKPGEKEVQQVWSDALVSVLKAVPVYEYDLGKVMGTRQLAVVSNKVEGFQKDKVLFLQIMDNDMLGFRIARGDIAFAYTTHEIENNSICLLEYNGARVLRQIKKLEGEKVLLVSNNGTLMTETAAVKDVKVLARLVRVEVKV